jgi:hypothetical protein
MNTKPKWLQSNKRVLEWEREPGGICVVAAYGYAFEPDPDHNCAEHMHFYPNSAEARLDLKLLRPCSCLRCTSKGKLA